MFRIDAGTHIYNDYGLWIKTTTQGGVSGTGGTRLRFSSNPTSNYDQIGEIKGLGWNQLITSETTKNSAKEILDPKLIHWTLGGPWFNDQRNMGGDFAIEWFKARDEAMKLWD